MNTSNYDPKTKDLGYDNSTTFSNAKFGELVKRVSALESDSSGSGCECALGWQKLYEGTCTEDEIVTENGATGIIKLIKNSELGGIYQELLITIDITDSDINDISNVAISLNIINDFQNDPIGIATVSGPIVPWEGNIKYIYIPNTSLTDDPISIQNTNNDSVTAVTANVLPTGLFFDKVHLLIMIQSTSFINAKINVFGRCKIANAVVSNFSFDDLAAVLSGSNSQSDGPVH